MFKVTGQVEEVGQLEEGHGFVVTAGEVTIRVTGLAPSYVKKLGHYLYSAVTVAIDDCAQGLFELPFEDAVPGGQ